MKAILTINIFKFDTYRNYKRKLLIFFFFFGLALFAQTITPSNIDYHINSQIDKNYKSLHHAMGNAADYPYNALYDSEVELHNTLKYALQKNDIRLLEKLITLFMLPLPSRHCSNQYTTYYCGAKNYTKIALPKSYCYWRYPATEAETTSASAQFLAMISQAINGILSLPYQTEVMTNFINAYKDVLILDHYDRWINGISFYMLTPWDSCSGFECGNFMDIIDYRLNHVNDSTSYCNVIVDTEMWIIDGVSNVLAANAKDPKTFPIPQTIKNQFLIFLEKGTQLLKKRTQDTSLTNFKNLNVTGSILDKGKLSTHPDYEYANYTGMEFPGCMERQYSRQVGMDISHAGRLTYLFSDLYFNKKFVPTQSTISFDEVKKIANQFAYKIFNRDFKWPAFSNFWDGSNGWYRVNYANRKGFGYAPNTLSPAISYGYGFLQHFNADVKTIFLNQLDFLQSTDPIKIEYKNNIFSIRNVSGDRCLAGPLVNVQEKVYLMRFLPNLFTWNPLLTNNDKKENPYIIYSQGYKTPNALYTTSVATADNKSTACAGRPQNNLWFSFVATANTQSIFVLSGNEYGHIKKPVLALWNHDGSEEMACFSSKTKNNAFLSTNKLIIGNTYLISIDNFDKGGKGSFTLFSNNSEMQTLQPNNVAAPNIGEIRFNSVLSKIQGYDGKDWIVLN